jgi:GT2 family glycosyltransferase
MDEPLQSDAHLSVSIVLHDSSLGMLRGALDSLEASARVAREAGCLRRVTVTLVDNASAATYRKQLEQMVVNRSENDHFQVSCALLPSNLGFGYGHNAAIESLTSDYHLVLNPDVELESDTLRSGLCFLGENEDVVLLSPKVFGREGEQEYLCKRYPSVLVLLLRGFAPRFLHRLFRRQLANYEMRDVCSGEGHVNVAIASGCFMLMRTPVLRSVGGFNDSFFLYFEDFDLSLRLEQRGRLVFDPAMRIVHHGGYAASKGWQHLRYFITSGIMFFNRHGWRWI